MVVVEDLALRLLTRVTQTCITLPPLSLPVMTKEEDLIPALILMPGIGNIRVRQ